MITEISGTIAATLALAPETLAPRVARRAFPVILESGPAFGEAGRWCIYLAEPRLSLVVRGGEIRLEATQSTNGLVESADWQRRRWNDPRRAIDEVCSWFELGHESEPPAPDECPFRGGLAGWLGYELGAWFERVPVSGARRTGFEELRLGLYDTYAFHDRMTGRTELRAVDLLREGRRAAQRRLGRWLDWLQESPPDSTLSQLDGPLRSNFDRDQYERAVEQVLEYIRAGDIYQVNLSQRFEGSGTIDPIDIYQRLRSRSPAPFAAYLNAGNRAIVSASPEWFYQTRGRRIVTRPIKGTRPRGSSAAEDRRLVEELQASAKDRAELTMIVDLERNDLGRVCEVGTVRVRENHVIETFASVHHLVATIEGELARGVGPGGVVAALFPGGSITGAPKIRAMEIIDELEQSRRDVYTGSIGYISHGASGFSIAIRTILIEGRRVSYQVGGGIVAESEPALEYEETLAKGRAIREVLEGWQPGC